MIVDRRSQGYMSPASRTMTRTDTGQATNHISIIFIMISLQYSAPGGDAQRPYLWKEPQITLRNNGARSLSARYHMGLLFVVFGFGVCNTMIFCIA